MIYIKEEISNLWIKKNKNKKNQEDKRENDDCSFSSWWNDKNLGKAIVVEPVISHSSPNNALH